MINISVVMPSKIQKPMGIKLDKLKVFYLLKNCETDAKIIESALNNKCVAFRYSYHKRNKELYYISITFSFMEKAEAVKFFVEYSKIVE